MIIHKSVGENLTLIGWLQGLILARDGEFFAIILSIEDNQGREKLVQPQYLFGRLSWGVFLFLTVAIKAATAQTTPDQFCQSDLSAEIDEMIDNSQSRWGIIIQSRDSEEILYQHNAEQFFIPASNTKLFTSAIALDQLDRQFQITTPVYQQGTPPTLETLQIQGRGDPTLTSADLENLASRLQAKGVQAIETVILETGYFSQPYANSTWEWEDRYAFYGSPANSLILDENSVNLKLTPTAVGEDVEIVWENAIAALQWNLTADVITVSSNGESNLELRGQLGTAEIHFTGKLLAKGGSVVWGLAIPKPDHYFRDTLLQAFSKEGISVKNIEFARSYDEEVGKKLMTFHSPPLWELLEEINVNSNNLYAESLLRILIAESPFTQAEIMTKALTELGLNPESYHFVDGSGLSRRNFVTPSAIAQLLTENYESFRSLLPIAGVNGTLENRFQNTPLEGKLQAKTGTLTGISALSGYVELSQPLVFSLMINYSQVSTSQQRKIMDQILLLLPRLDACQ